MGAGPLAGLIMNVSQFVLHAVVLAPDGAKLMEDWAKRGLTIAPEETKGPGGSPGPSSCRSAAAQPACVRVVRPASCRA
jgi:hypothetical protein